MRRRTARCRPRLAAGPTLNRRTGLSFMGRRRVAGEGRAGVRRLAPLAGRARGGRGFCRALPVLPCPAQPALGTSLPVPPARPGSRAAGAGSAPNRKAWRHVLRGGAGDEAPARRQQVPAVPESPSPVPSPARAAAGRRGGSWRPAPGAIRTRAAPPPRTPRPISGPAAGRRPVRRRQGPAANGAAPGGPRRRRRAPPAGPGAGPDRAPGSVPWNAGRPGRASRAAPAARTASAPTSCGATVPGTRASSQRAAIPPAAWVGHVSVPLPCQCFQYQFFLPYPVFRLLSACASALDPRMGRRKDLDGHPPPRRDGAARAVPEVPP